MVPAILAACLVATLIVLRLCGLLRPFAVPTGGMTPAVSAGDHVVMEDITFLSREPRRGDIVLFKTDGIPTLPPAQFYVKRVAGQPGDHLQISDGNLFINEKQVWLSNNEGRITYDLPPYFGASVQTNVTVPNDCYFVIGDNSTNSLDSRFWGSLPRANIIGRVPFCYWPPHRMGAVK